MSASVVIWWLDNFCQPNVCEVNLKCTNSDPGKGSKSCNCHSSSKTWATHIRLPDTLTQLLPDSQLSETPFHANTGSEISKTTRLFLSLSNLKVRNTEQNRYCIRNKTAPDNKYGKRRFHLAVYSVVSMPLLHVVMVPVWGQRDHLLVYAGFLSDQTLFSEKVFATFHAL